MEIKFSINDAINAIASAFIGFVLFNFWIYSYLWLTYGLPGRFVYSTIGAIFMILVGKCSTDKYTLVWYSLLLSMLYYAILPTNSLINSIYYF